MISLRKIHHRISLIILIVICISCQKNTLYHSYQPVNSTGWHRSDTLFYQLPSPISKDNNLQYEIGIRHEATYKYQDLWLTVNQDTLHLYLSDAIGYWKGDGIGNIRQYTHTFQLAGEMEDSIREFKITHIMEENPLPGICDIGIRIMKPVP